MVPISTVTPLTQGDWQGSDEVEDRLVERDLRPGRDEVEFLGLGWGRP